MYLFFKNIVIRLKMRMWSFGSGQLMLAHAAVFHGQLLGPASPTQVEAGLNVFCAFC